MFRILILLFLMSAGLACSKVEETAFQPTSSPVLIEISDDTVQRRETGMVIEYSFRNITTAMFEQAQSRDPSTSPLACAAAILETFESGDAKAYDDLTRFVETNMAGQIEIVEQPEGLMGFDEWRDIMSPLENIIGEVWCGNYHHFMSDQLTPWGRQLGLSVCAMEAAPPFLVWQHIDPRSNFVFNTAAMTAESSRSNVSTEGLTRIPIFPDRNTLEEGGAFLYCDASLPKPGDPMVDFYAGTLRLLDQAANSGAFGSDAFKDFRSRMDERSAHRVAGMQKDAPEGVFPIWRGTLTNQLPSVLSLVITCSDTLYCLVGQKGPTEALPLVSVWLLKEGDTFQIRNLNVQDNWQRFFEMDSVQSGFKDAINELRASAS